MENSVEQRFIDQRILYGSHFQRFIRELVLNSGAFWLFDTVNKVASKGFITYLTDLPQWVLLGASLVQAWVMSRDDQEYRWWYFFIAPTLYTLIDVWIETPAGFFSEVYHIFYWVWSAAMAFAYMLGTQSKTISIFSKSVLLVILLPATYLFSELATGLRLNGFMTLRDYWLDDASHFFILFGSLLLGMALGITTLMRDRFERLLYDWAAHFEQIASWSFDRELIEKAYTDDLALDLQRVERTVLFMDIRGFTPWSEAHSPHEVVRLINTFYQAAEPIIKSHNGFKIQVTGDEIMTRFYSPEDAVLTALELQPIIANTLNPLTLSAGIGIHVGEVVEGLVGGNQTKQYGIFGDTVNTAARLQGQARANEIVISPDVAGRVEHITEKLHLEQREVVLKGKTNIMNVDVIPMVLA
ncbi:MAG: adenylate/guanylate cyclase domain-containing protein [Anaerolineae bacterium]|nr:adenylate/guanylate cyclase domain-containing protein [Anaerolineae bacterium]